MLQWDIASKNQFQRHGKTKNSRPSVSLAAHARTSFFFSYRIFCVCVCLTPIISSSFFFYFIPWPARASLKYHARVRRQIFLFLCTCTRLVCWSSVVSFIHSDDDDDSLSPLSLSLSLFYVVCLSTRKGGCCCFCCPSDGSYSITFYSRVPWFMSWLLARSCRNIFLPCVGLKTSAAPYLVSFADDIAAPARE